MSCTVLLLDLEMHIWKAFRGSGVLGGRSHLLRGAAALQKDRWASEATADAPRPYSGMEGGASIRLLRGGGGLMRSSQGSSVFVLYFQGPSQRRAPIPTCF